MVFSPVTILILRTQGILTERVAPHLITHSPFSPGFLLTGRSRFIYIEMEVILTQRGVMNARSGVVLLFV